MNRPPIARGALRHSVVVLISTVALAAAAIAAGSPAARARGNAHGSRSPSLSWQAGSLKEVYVPPAGEYSYAPATVQVGSTRWVWTCHNAQSRVIRDHIYMEKFEHGRLVSDTSVLQGTDGNWDSFHTCDPSVIAGRFHFRDIAYRWAMFYLGNDLDASAHNQIGVAFAKTPDGPWVKDPTPVVPFADRTQWGAGQPTAVTADARTGRVLLMYTQGDTATRAFWRSVDLGQDAGPVVSPARPVPTAGLRGTDGSVDYLNNYDVAYDPGRHSFLAVREQHPYPSDNPSWIGSSVDVDMIDAAGLLRGTGTWHSLGAVTQTLTGLPRNHNAGLVRTSTGTLPRESAVTVMFTSSCSGPTCDSLFNYDLWEVTGTLR